MADWAFLQQAINDVKRRAAAERAFQELADWLQKNIANPEQYKAELEKQIAKLEAEKANWKNQADALIKAANDQATQILVDAKTSTAGATQVANAMKAEAANTVNKMIADAKAQAQEMIDNAQAKVNSAQAELKLHLAAIDRAKAEVGDRSDFLRAVNDAIALAAGKRDELMKHIADLKAKFS